MEFQATAEHNSFDDAQLDQMKDLARAGIVDLLFLQKQIIDAA